MQWVGVILVVHFVGTDIQVLNRSTPSLRQYCVLDRRVEVVRQAKPIVSTQTYCTAALADPRDLLSRPAPSSANSVLRRARVFLDSRWLNVGC